MLEAAYTVYSGTETTLSLDAIVKNLNITHLDFREYLVNNGHKLPPVTRGLANEVLDYSDRWHVRKIIRKFNLTTREYRDILRNRANKRGLSGNDIIDIRRKRSAGTSVPQLAQDYKVTEGRIYQLTNGYGSDKRKKRKELSFDDKLTMAKEKQAGSTVKDLSTKYKITENTVYVYLRQIGSVG